MPFGLLSLGHAPSNPNNNRVTLNVFDPGVGTAYANLAKGFGFQIKNTNADVNGFPISTPATDLTSNPNMPSRYYGSYTWGWTGQGSMNSLAFPSIIINSGGLSIDGFGTASGERITGNLSMTTKTAPLVEFSFGWNIQSISNNGSGLIRVTSKTGYVTNGMATGNLVNITGANANTGANGEWTITKIDAQTIDLVGSTFTNAQASAGGTAIYAPTNLNIRISAAGTFSGFTNIIWCRTADYTAVAAGTKIWADDYVNELKYLFNHTGNPSTSGWLRFMDFTGVQNSFEGDSSPRRTLNSISYSSASSWFPKDLFVGTITNTSDALACSDPTISVWNGSSYIDNATVFGNVDVTNSGASPTLAVGGHPAKPVYNYNRGGAAPIIITWTAPPTTPGTDVLTFTFSAGGASWFNGGSDYVYNYTSAATDTTTSNLAARIDALFALSAASGGANDVLSPALVYHGNLSGGRQSINPRCPLDGRLTCTYTSGTATGTIGTLSPTDITGGLAQGEFTFNYLLDGWIYKSGGTAFGGPWEAAINLCNTVGAHCWYNIPALTKGQFVTDLVNYFGDSTTGLTNGLRFGAEIGNEVWNSSAFPYGIYNTQGMCLGLNWQSFQSVYNFTALRTIQLAALGRAAWATKGRTASDFYIMSMSQGADSINGNFNSGQLNNTKLASSNSIYTNHGGLGGGSAPDYTAAGSRCVDITTVIGMAPYWNSPWMGHGSFTTASQVNDTVANNAPWLQAALDYSNGLISTAFTALVNQFNGTVSTPAPASIGTSLARWASVYWTPEETTCASYDTFRASQGIAPLGIMDYEGGPSFGIGNDGNNGVNSVNSTDIGVLASRMTALAWNVSSYTHSGTNDTTEMATMVFTMLQAWKFDTSYSDMIKTSYFQARETISGAQREVHAAHYGNGGTNWTIYPSSLYAGNPYTYRNALHEWNAGG